MDIEQTSKNKIPSKKKVMTIDEMVAAKESWKRFFKIAKNNLKKIQYIEETRENCWELKSLEMSYTYFIDQINKIVGLYRELIIIAQEDEMNEYIFNKVMQALQLVNKNLHIEYNKKNFKALNVKYVEDLREAKSLC